MAAGKGRKGSTGRKKGGKKTKPYGLVARGKLRSAEDQEASARMYYEAKNEQPLPLLISKAEALNKVVAKRIKRDIAAGVPGVG